MNKGDYLYTAKEISEMEVFGPKKIITPYKITQNWVKNGLKFVKGTKKQMLFKLAWIDEYLETEARNNSKKVISLQETNRENKNSNFTRVK